MNSNRNTRWTGSGYQRLRDGIKSVSGGGGEVLSRERITFQINSGEMDRIIYDCNEGGNGTKEDLLFLHLLKYNTLRERYIVPGLFTQHGLRSVLGCDQSYISRLLRKNEKEGLICRKVNKVENMRHRQNVYFLTDEGIGFALALVRNISKSNTIKSIRNP